MNYLQDKHQYIAVASLYRNSLPDQQFRVDSTPISSDDPKKNNPAHCFLTFILSQDLEGQDFNEAIKLSASILVFIANANQPLFK